MRMNTKSKCIHLGLVLTIVVMGVSCASRKVERASVDTITDLSGRWNDTDSRLVSEAMVSDMLSRPWINTFLQKQLRNPIVIAGYIKNRSSEHVETQTFIKDIERALINSGKATVVASRGERGQLREERLDQRGVVRAETMKKLKQETGADYMLVGDITSQFDSLDRKSTITYQTNLELVDIETNEKVWLGTKKIKKLIKQRFLRP